jgi:hypothetical protein
LVPATVDDGCCRRLLHGQPDRHPGPAYPPAIVIHVVANAIVCPPPLAAAPIKAGSLPISGVVELVANAIVSPAPAHSNAIVVHPANAAIIHADTTAVDLLHTHQPSEAHAGWARTTAAMAVSLYYSWNDQ